MFSRLWGGGGQESIWCFKPRYPGFLGYPAEGNMFCLTQAAVFVRVFGLHLTILVLGEQARRSHARVSGVFTSRLIECRESASLISCARAGARVDLEEGAAQKLQKRRP